MRCERGEEHKRSELWQEDRNTELRLSIYMAVGIHQQNKNSL